MTRDQRKLVHKRMEFVYPNAQGKAEWLHFNLMAWEDEAETFDKFLNYLLSCMKASGMKDVPIHDYVSEHDTKPETNH